MIKLTLSQRLLERADASDEDCRTDDGDIMREADEALKAKDTEIADLRSEVVMLREDLARTERNRDMFKGQVERQSSQLTEMRVALTPAVEKLASIVFDGEDHPIIAKARATLSTRESDHA